MPDRPWQFSLKHLFAVTLAVALLLGVMKGVGVFGIGLLGLPVGLTLCCHGLLYRNTFTCLLGAVMVGLSAAVLCAIATSPKVSRAPHPPAVQFAREASPAPRPEPTAV